MQANPNIKPHLKLLNSGDWAERLESIEFLKSLESKEDVIQIINDAADLEDFTKHHELIQVFEALIKDGDNLSVWQGAFYGLFELSENLDEDGREQIDETLEELFTFLLGRKKDFSRFDHKRPELVYVLARVWRLCSRKARFLMVRKIIKFQVKELYNLSVVGLIYGDYKSSINILRVLVHAKERRLVPVLKRWLREGDEVKMIEALRALAKVGGVFEYPFVKGFLHSKNDKVRLEACLCLIKLTPFSHEKMLKSFWQNESNQANKRKVIQALGNQNTLFSLRFLSHLLMVDFDSELEADLLNSLSKLRHPQKVKKLTVLFSKAADEKKLLILMCLKGRPYPELESFYLKNLDRVSNPILKVIILESLAGFTSSKVANVLFRYLMANDDYTCGSALNSLAVVDPKLTSEFITNHFLKRDEQSDIITKTFLKLIPSIHQFLPVTSHLTETLSHKYDTGSPNEKTLILRALPYLLIPEVFNLIVNDLKVNADGALEQLKATTLIKCTFLNTDFLEGIIPLMDNKEFVRAFKKNKLKVKFCESLGLLLLNHNLKETQFVQSIFEQVLTVFMDNMNQFEIPGVIVYYLEECISHPELIKEKHFSIAEDTFKSNEHREIARAYHRFLLLNGTVDSFHEFLKVNPNIESLNEESMAIRLAFGAAQ